MPNEFIVYIQPLRSELRRVSSVLQGLWLDFCPDELRLASLCLQRHHNALAFVVFIFHWNEVFAILYFM